MRTVERLRRVEEVTVESSYHPLKQEQREEVRIVKIWGLREGSSGSWQPDLCGGNSRDESGSGLAGKTANWN